MTRSSVVSVRLKPVTKDLGEMTVRRSLPGRGRRSVGPFVFFDHMGPAEFAPGSGINVRAHPHIGLATITYLFEGEILHRDSLGCVQPIRPGEVNWMTAGSGIVHSEKTRDELLADGQRLHGIQVWVALPQEHEEVEPRFEHYAAADIPVVTREGTRATVVVGTAYGVESPVRSESDTLYVELRLPPGGRIALPVAEELGVYVLDGEVSVDGEALSCNELTVLADRREASLSAASAAHVMLCGGAALDGHRTIWWNFVSSSTERIEQAKRDWKEGRFAPVPGETDFIPLPDD